MWSDKKKDSGQARMTRRRRILSILDRRGQAKSEWTRSPCSLRSVIPACRESFFVKHIRCGRIKRRILDKPE